MVMEASPSPQSVGREFVRQYYTLLNQAPAHLHRFYNQHSSFVHGGLDSNKDSAPAIGQKQIHQKIQQLNFRDCHAKISQVDSQLTLENGVVVQVSGELSNAGQPMRRFTQTFVLAIQAPKKYYVHNDIFRYQDMIFPDEEETDVSGVESGINESGEREGEEGGRSEQEEDDHQNQGQQFMAAISNEPPVQPSLIPSQQPPLQQQQIFYPPQPQQHVHQVIQQVLNGSVHEESPLIAQQPQPQQQQQLTTTSPPPAQQHQYIVEPTTQQQFTQETELDATNEQPQQENELQSQTEENREQQEAETFSGNAQEPESDNQASTVLVNNSGPTTYANRVKSYPTTAGVTSPQASKISISPPPMTSLRSDERSPLHPASSGSTIPASGNTAVTQQSNRIVGNAPQQQNQHQQQRASRGGPIQRDGDRRGTRPGQYTDAHQLFLGNLPHNASESELREIFERYGKVVDLRIHSKTNDRSKPQGGSIRVPNYGFITFEDPQVVTKLLKNPGIYYPDMNGQKLNIEEKKFRPRLPMEGSGGRLNSGDGNMRPMGGQQQQQLRGSGGPRGVTRGGQHGARVARGSFNRSEGTLSGLNKPGNPGYQIRR
ncbi:ras GTPase-activating protein-binding protein 1 [Prorops nasuta]|uniref:ras GTPase-activating protein-binding protein 1 n=1 Tax=Prorops nasuta TaxID=863751 RepID=UPI0034CE6F55